MRSEAKIDSKILSLQNEYERSKNNNDDNNRADQYIHGWIEALMDFRKS